MENPLKKKQLVEFQFEFSNTTEKPDNPEFSYGKAKILYTGKNRNNSFITNESVKKALPTLFGIPIVGEYNEDTDNFGGHGGKIEMTDKGVKFIDTTVPFGYISENANAHWETVEELDGTKRDYFVVDKCVFWTDRYPQLNTLLKNGKFNQSMEIKVNDGSFAVIDGQDTFRIDDFTFSALCILGIATEEDPEGDVEPCFENASIEIYENSNFQMKFNHMLEQFNKGKREGGQPVTDKKETPETEVKEEFEAENQEVEVEAEETEEVEVEKTEVPAEDFEEEKDDNEEDKEEEKEEEEEDKFEAQSENTPADPSENVVNEDFAKLKADYELEVASSKKLAEQLAEVKSDFAKLEEEVVELRTFKRQTELTEVAEKFSGKLEDDILKSTIEANADKSVVELESLLYAEIGKQNFSVKDKKEKEMFSMAMSEKTETQEKEPYNGLFKTYGKSN